MNREYLESLGLEKDVIDKVMAAHGKAIGEYKDQAGKLERLSTENESLKSQITERDKDLKDLRKNAGDNEELAKKYSELEGKYKADTEKLTQQLSDTKLHAALDGALTAAKVRNPRTLQGLLDMDKIKLTDDGKLDGLDDQLTAIRKDNAYLFQGDPKPEYEPAGNGQPVGGDIKNIMANPKLNLTEALANKGADE